MEALQHSQLNVDLSLVLSSCEPELQELMRQIDLIIKQQKRDWDAEMQLVRNRLKRSEDELMLSRKLIEQKDLQVRSLCQRLEEQQKLADRYEQQVQNIRAEFDKLKRGYHKLQHRRLEESRPGLSTARLDATGRFRRPEDFSSDGKSQQVQSSSTQLGQDSSGTRQVKEWDRSPFSGGSEGAIQRLLQQFHIMSSVSEGNSLRLAQDGACLSSPHSSSSTSGSGSTIRTWAPHSAADEPQCTSKESLILALQVKETHPASSVDGSRADGSHTLCCFLEEENQRSTELLHRLDGHIQCMKGHTWRTPSKQPGDVLAPGPPSELFLA